MDTYNPSKLTAKPIKSDLTLRQLADFDESGGSRDRVDNVRSNQVLVSLSNINRPQTFSFRYISDLIKGGTGIESSTKDGVTTISNSGVTKIIAGTNITISPVTGVGNVTVNAASGGITSLNLLTAAAQTFVNDTNVSIVSSGTTHTLTWLGTLADSRIASAATWNAKFTLPALTSGSVLFSDGTTIAQNNTNFFWDNTNSRLGVGTNTLNAKTSIVSTTALTGLYVENLGSATSPSAVFKNNQNTSYASVDIIGGSFITNSNKFQFGQYSTGDAFFFLVGNNLLDFFTNSVNRMRIFGNGNITIGTITDSGYKLDVNGTARVALKLSVGTPSAASALMEVTSTTLGFLPPRMTTTQKNAIASPASGLVVYDNTLNATNYYNGTSWVDRGSDIEAGKKVLSFFTDFLANNALDGLQTFTSGGSAGTVGGTLIPGRTNQQGVIFMQTGVVATNYIFYSSGTVQLWLGGGAWNYETFIYINNLSTLTDRYRLIFGFGSGTTNSTETDGVFLTYDEGGTANGTASSANWQCVTVQNSTRTLTTTTTAVVAAAWLKLRIEINAAGTSVAFYLNGTLLATHTTNIPVPNRYILIKQGIAKTIGTTSLGFYCDYIGYENILTTPR